jgi:uncharacterized protein (TIGR02246 family)
VLGALATAAIAVGVAYFLFLWGDRRLGEVNAQSENDVIAVYNRLVAAAEARDADQMFSYFVANDSGALVTNGEVSLTREIALRRMRDSMADIAAVKYRLGAKNVTLLSDTVALMIVEGRSQARTNDGRELAADFAQTLVFVKRNGEWRVLHAHHSTLQR